MRKKNIAWNIIDEKTDTTRGHTESTEITERKHGVPLLGWRAAARLDLQSSHCEY